MPKLQTKEKLQDLLKKQDAIKNHIASLEARLRTEEDRKLTRKKILSGAYLLDKYKGQDSQLAGILNDFLIRDNDRILFGLTPLSKTEITKNVRRKNTDSQNEQIKEVESVSI
jgi:hypothetical protein